MSRPPDRKRAVFLLGAGFSCAAGLPNTAALLDRVHSLARSNTSWGVSKDLETRLQDAYEYFYPEKGPGFRPEVVDFFSVLTAYNQIDQGGLTEGFPDRELLADLRFAIVHVICDGLRVVASSGFAATHELLDRMIKPGNVVITTNWDTLVERAAEDRGVRYRLSGAPHDRELLILKLHGSIDWLKTDDAKKPLGKVAYATLVELCNSTRARLTAPTSTSGVIRTRVQHVGTTWRTIKGATKNPFMLTMTPGKAGSLRPLITLWEQAYKAVSAASDLEIVGYSMPADDIEIRTLLRAGVQRGRREPRIVVRNPAPDVHSRVRELILRGIKSDYTPVPSLHA